MAWCELPRPQKVFACVAMLAAGAMPRPGSAQLDIGSRSDDVLTRIVETIGEVQSDDGVQSPELIDPLTALALYYQEQGDHVLEIAAIEQARQVVRVNYGLYSFDEVPLLRQWIRAEEARGNHAAAWDVEKRLINLIGRHSDDLRTVPILEEIAERRLDILEDYLAGGYPPEIVLGCYYAEYDNGNCRAGSRGHAKEALLREAVSYYGEAIDTILRVEGYSSDELPGLLMKVVRIAYEYGRRGLGRRSLRHLLAYNVENSAPDVEQTEALVQIADWDLLFARGDRHITEGAHDVYVRAYDQLERSGTEERSIESIFSPELPVVLPAFEPNPLLSRKTPETTGFIDVAFDIDEDGESDDIEVLATTTNASDDEEDRLVDVIEQSRFRPIVADGRVEEKARVAVRYYLNE